jgi:hypothetical protein
MSDSMPESSANLQANTTNRQQEGTQINTVTIQQMSQHTITSSHNKLLCEPFAQH